MIRSLRALIVDDSETNRILIMEMLKDLAVCVEAENGKEALELYSNSLGNGKYDLMLLDIAMPHMDGIELLKIIREKEKSSNMQRLPVLIVTAQIGSVERAKAAGCDDVVLKPIEADVLLEKIESLIGKN
jgi:CheY-like chemotaxis protein